MTTTEADLALEARVDARRETFRFQAVDGLWSPETFRPPELLLLETLWDGGDLGHLLALESNYGVVGTVLAETAATTTLAETSARAARCCRRNLDANRAVDGRRSRDATVAIVDDATALAGPFDTIAYAPKPDTPLSMGCRRLADALTALTPGGRLAVAAAKRTGLARFERFLDDHAAAVTRRGSRGDYRLLEATAPERVDAPSCVTPRRLQPTVDGVDLSLVAVPGLFAAGGLDDGTRLLAETATVDDGERVLDCCCGYGAVGAWAGSRADLDLWLTDDDLGAVRCARRSLEATGVEGTVVAADATAGVADRTFDRVFCNPPTHAGDGVLADIFVGIRDVLAADGVATVVHHRALDLRRHFARFGAVDRVATGAEHVVLRARP
ncbi:MAG: methyltransferase [Halolamina sp.]